VSLLAPPSEKLALRRLSWSSRPRILWSWSGRVGCALLVFVFAVAFVGPLVSPHSPYTTVGPPAAGPSAKAPLGTDFLGRDVLSRVLHGGASVLELATITILLTYALGISVGMIAGYNRSVLDSLLMRAVDLVLAFPAMLLLLVLVTGAGTGVGVLIVGVALVLFPGVARIVRTATLEASVRAYVEAAVSRGEKTIVILTREIFPNITPVVIADFGIRFGGAIILIASLNFLSLGLRPPTADWGLMISENREIITTNGWAVIAPAVMLALLTVAINLIGDAYTRSLGLSGDK